MRFKRYILLSLVLCGLVACSDDNTIEIPEAPVLEREGCDDEGGRGGYSYGRRREYAYGRGVRYGLEYGIYGER